MVAALKSQFEHFKLQTAGNKPLLVDHLHSHLQADTTNGQQARTALLCCHSKCLTNRWSSSNKP